MSISYDRVGLLLHVVEKAAGHGGRLAAIASAAQAELNKINDDAMMEAKALAAKIEADKAEALAAQQAATGTTEVEVGDEDPETKPKPQSKTDATALDNMRRM